MASYDGTNKSSAGCAQHLPYWEINAPYTRELYNEAMAEASPEAVKFCNPDGYNGPEIEVDASTLTEDSGRHGVQTIWAVLTFPLSLAQTNSRRILICSTPRLESSRLSRKKKLLNPG